MKIEYLFPEICNLYGDYYNVEYLSKSCADIEVVKTSLNDVPYFVNNIPKMIYIGSMTEKYQKVVLEKLKPYKERLFELIEKENVPMLVTGNALEIFGKEIIEEDGSKVKCLGLFDTVAKQDMMHRHNSLYLGKFNDGNNSIEITGFKSQFTQSYGERKKGEPLFETTRGFGFDGGETGEGIKINNFMGTYVLGPLLILNPLLTKHILRLMGADDKLIFEDVAMDVYNTRLSEYKEPTRGFTY